MSFLRQLNRVRFIDYLIQKKATGTPETFARKNQLSKRCLNLVIQELRELGFPIKYSRTAESYYYEEQGQMIKALFVKDHERVDSKYLAEINASDPANICFSETTVFSICTG